jgi:hypothetical protein
MLGVMRVRERLEGVLLGVLMWVAAWAAELWAIRAIERRSR